MGIYMVWRCSQSFCAKFSEICGGSGLSSVVLGVSKNLGKLIGCSMHHLQIKSFPSPILILILLRD